MESILKAIERNEKKEKGNSSKNQKEKEDITWESDVDDDGELGLSGSNAVSVE